MPTRSTTADPLQRYRGKRDFTITGEPQGGKPAGEALSFVIQKHAARRLHYDFRLELDGTLKSWAVPKGPSLDPGEKRMAVHVEDHPIDYGGFEGVIPPGQYGAGTVSVWDRGAWEPVGDPRAGYREGKLKFDLHGEKLQGRWNLVRMRGRSNEKQEPWLLIKERDDWARPAAQYSVVDALPDSVLSGVGKKGKKSAKAKPPLNGGTGAKRKATKYEVPAGAKKAKLPLTLSPQLATLVDQVPDRGEWIYELKFDGYRLLTRVDGAEIRLFTRNGHDWTAKLKSLAKAIQALGLSSAWLDGEIVIQNEHGIPDFQMLQNAFDTSRTQDILYFLFDLPFFGGYDLRETPLRERRQLLRSILESKSSTLLNFSEDFSVSARELLHTACEMRMEGLIGKRADAVYVSRRMPTWIKLKCTRRQEFVIGGYTDPKGSRVGLGSLLLGIHDPHGNLKYAGNVGAGFNTKILADLTAKLEKLRTDQSPFTPVPKKIKGHWVKPKLVAEVSFGEWTDEGRIRHSVYHGLRTDKPVKAISKEKPAQVTPVKLSPKNAKATRSASLPADITITHPDRVIDPSSGITKLELAHYYAKIASLILPHLKSRPVSLVRAPTGITGHIIFQKHGAPVPGIKHLDERLDPGHESLMEVSNELALIGCVQQNVIEFHTWNGTTAAIEQPDRMSFDLDPGEGLRWGKMLEGAELVGGFLGELGLKSFLKTSGGKGLHIVVPFKPDLEWDAVKSLARAIVEHLALQVPDRFVSKSGAKNRVGKIFIDYLRNGRGATTVAAWSARARAGIGVSVPMDWAELGSLKNAAQWSIRNIDERLSMKDCWAGYAAARRQTLNKALKTLQSVQSGKTK